MSLPENLGRLSSALTSDASLNIGVGVTPSGSFKLEVGTTSKFTGIATFGSTLSNGTYSYTLPSATGILALTSDIHSAVTLSAIGSTANANGATLTGQVLNLQPADASFGGVVTTGTQTFAGAKTFSSALTGTSATFSGNVIFDTTDRGLVSNTVDGSDNKFVSINGGGARGSDRGGTINLFGNEATGTGRIDINAGDVVGGVVNLVTQGLNRLTVNRDGTTTFTGALSGTSATFTSTGNAVTITSSSSASNVQLKVNNGANGDIYAGVAASDGSSVFTGTTAYSGYIGTNVAVPFYIATGGTARLTIASTGAATFSGNIVQSGTSNIIQQSASNSYSGGSVLDIYNISATGYGVYIKGGGTSQYALSVNNYAGTNLFTILGSGAATFSSTLTAGSQIISELSTANDIRLLINPTATAVKISATYNTTGSYQPLTFLTSDTERMRITSNSDRTQVAIGTDTVIYTAANRTNLTLATPAANSVLLGFKINGSSKGYLFHDGGTFQIVSDGSTDIAMFPQSAVKAGADNAYTMGASGARWSAIWAANGTIQTSDARKKKDITPTKLGLDFIMQLNPVSYKWKNGGNKVETFEAENENEVVKRTLTPISGKRTHYGLIAQEVKEVLGDIDFGGYVHDEETDTMALRYDQFISPLIKAIQELKAEIDLLKGIAPN
jgi:hypothetical protein